MPTKKRTPGLTRGGSVKGRIGQPPHIPTEKNRENVRLWSAYGTPQQKMADKLKISLDTLVNHYRADIDEGIKFANAELGGVLFNQAKSGNVRALEQWFDRRGGPEWKRKVAQEHSGPDGGPIRYSDLTEEEIDAKLEELRKADGADPSTET